MDVCLAHDKLNDFIFLQPTLMVSSPQRPIQYMRFNWTVTTDTVRVFLPLIKDVIFYFCDGKAMTATNEEEERKTLVFVKTTTTTNFLKL